MILIKLVSTSCINIVFNKKVADSYKSSCVLHEPHFCIHQRMPSCRVHHTYKNLETGESRSLFSNRFKETFFIVLIFSPRLLLLINNLLKVSLNILCIINGFMFFIYPTAAVEDVFE